MTNFAVTRQGACLSLHAMLAHPFFMGIIQQPLQAVVISTQYQGVLQQPLEVLCQQQAD